MASPGHHTAVDIGCLCDLSTEHDPWRASALAWRTGGDDDGLLGALEPINLLFELGDLLLSLGQGTRRICDPIDLGRQTVNQHKEIGSVVESSAVDSEGSERKSVCMASVFSEGQHIYSTHFLL
jgi:hypothetical protein